MQASYTYICFKFKTLVSKFSDSSSILQYTAGINFFFFLHFHLLNASCILICFICVCIVHAFTLILSLSLLVLLVFRTHL